MKVLVTGSAGFIGAHVVNALLKRGDKVIGIDNLNDYYDWKLKIHRSQLFCSKAMLNYQTYHIDFSYYEELEEVFEREKFDKICHLGAQAGVRYSLENPEAYIESNVKGTLNIFELAKKYKVKDIVYASSSSVYGDRDKVPFTEKDYINKPVSLYAATKISNEYMAYVYNHLYNLNMTGLRFFTVYGPWGRPDMAYFKFADLICNNKPIEVYNNGDHKRDFTYIDDIVDGVIKAIDNPFPYEIINLGNGEPQELKLFISLIEKELGTTAKKKMLPKQPGDVHTTYADISKARELLGYQPKIHLQKGIKKFIDWYKDYYKIQL